MTVTENRYLKVGDHLPPINFPTIEGGRIDLADFRGKRLILFMWASW